MPTSPPLPPTTSNETPPTIAHAGSAPLLTPPTGTPTHPQLTLYFHPLSPFSQKVWITALELSLTHLITLHKVVVAPIIKPKGWPGWSENNELVGAYNPVNKIPTLVVKYDGEDSEEFGVYDSKVICEFLEYLAGKQQQQQQPAQRNSVYWKRQALHRAADQVMDSKILITYEERIREPEGLYFPAWVEGMKMKINRGFDVMERAVQDGTLQAWSSSREGVGLEEVAVVCCLATADMSGVEWREEGRERLKWWFEEWKERASYKESRHDVEWESKKEG